MWFWNSIKLWIYNTKDLRDRLWLDLKEFNKLLEFEVDRYKKSVTYQFWKAYWDSKIKENPNVLKFWWTPMFKPHPKKTSSFIFNEDSWVFLEKIWSSKNKYNKWKDKPFDFIFKP